MREPQQFRSREKKRRLIEAGEYLFRRKGYHGTNSRDIARQAGVAIGSFYAYFKNKKALFMQVLQSYTDRILESVFEVDLGNLKQDPHTVVSRNLWKILRAHDAPELHRELAALVHTDHEFEELMRSWQRRSVAQFRASLDWAAPMLRVKDTEIAATITYYAVESVMQRLTMGVSEIEAKRIIDGTADMLCRYLLRDRTHSSG